MDLSLTRPRRGMLITALWVFAWAVPLPELRAWVSDSIWKAPSVALSLQLDSAPTPALTDGADSWNSLAEEAVQIWNVEAEGLDFETELTPDAGLGFGNGRNDVVWSAASGRPLGPGVVAVTYLDTSGGSITETDVIFNSNEAWDSYRGPLRPQGKMDFLRVALHEFGHVIGLDHPDEAGQRVVAVMNAFISDADNLQPDDVTGVRALYPGPYEEQSVPEPPEEEAAQGWVSLGAYGWCYKIDENNFWSEAYGWFWSVPEDRSSAWNFTLNTWTFGESSSGRIWTTAYGWLTALGENWYASSVGTIYGDDLNGWIWSETYGWVSSGGDGEWFWVHETGWINP